LAAAWVNSELWLKKSKNQKTQNLLHRICRRSKML